MGTIIRHALETSDFVICNFESFPSEWISLKTEPARHLIKLDIHDINGLHSLLEDYPSDTDLEWVAIPSSIDQLKQWRASM